jgi:uncharacterized membrane protein YhaH (DUF805 family)
MTAAQTDFMAIEEYRPRPPLFSMRGRIGRARYIVYGIGAICCAFLLMVLAGYGLVLAGSLGRMLYQLLFVSLYFCALPVFFLQLTIRRCHDFNMEGWLAVLLLAPVVNLMFWFIPGSRRENEYGREPEAETPGMRVAAVALPLLLIAAFLAADTQFPDQEKNPGTARPSTPLRPYTP